jgi:hypothetical protein
MSFFKKYIDLNTIHEYKTSGYLHVLLEEFYTKDYKKQHLRYFNLNRILNNKK